MATIINASTSNGLIQTADTSGILQLQSAGTTILQANAASATGLLGGIIQPYQYYELNTAVVGSNATGAQSILGVGVTLAASKIYEFEAVFALSKTAGVTSHTISLGFGGTATLNNILYVIFETGAGSALPTAIGTAQGAATNSVSAINVSGSIATAARTESFFLKGTVSVNAGGTFIPQYTLSAAPGGAYTTQIGSYFKISQLAASGANVNIGTWS